MRILSLDVSMTSTGWVVVQQGEGPANRGVLTLEDCGVIQTEKLETREVVSTTVDSMRRAVKINNTLRDAMGSQKFDIVVVEAMSWPRNAGTAIKMAMAWGAIAPLIRDYPLIEVGPQALKLAAAGSKSATKKEVEAGVRLQIPATSSELLETLIPKQALREHCWDALGAVLAAQKTEKWALLQAGRQAGLHQP